MLVTLGEVKDYLGIPLTNTTHDDFLNSQIALLSEAISAYCNRKFEATNYVQVYYRFDFAGEAGKELLTKEYPILLLPTAPVVKVDDEVVDPEEYIIHAPTGKFIRKKSSWFSGEEVEITYRAGFEVIPAPIKDVCFSVISQRFNRKKSGISLDFGSDVQRISIPGTISVDFDYSLSANERKSPFGNLLMNHLNVLDYYRSERAVVGSGKLSHVT